MYEGLSPDPVEAGVSNPVISVIASDYFPENVEIPPNAKEYVEKKQLKFFLAMKGDSLAGFIVCGLPCQERATATLFYKFVFPDRRRQGIGQKLSFEVHKWLRDNNYFEVTSGIQNVIRISPLDGSVSANLESQSDGGWKSYASYTHVDASLPLAHRVSMVSIDQSGFINLHLRTTLDAVSSQVLPADPEQLFEYLKTSSVLPQDSAASVLLSEARADFSAAYANGRKLSFAEYLAELTK